MNSGELIDYIRSMCQVSINAWSLLMADPVLEPAELIPVHGIRFHVGSAVRLASETIEKSSTEFISLPQSSREFQFHYGLGSGLICSEKTGVVSNYFALLK